MCADWSMCVGKVMQAYGCGGWVCGGGGGGKRGADGGTLTHDQQGSAQVCVNCECGVVGGGGEGGMP